MEEHIRKAVINHMWEENLGNNQKQDCPSKGIEEDVLFEFKDPDNLIDAEM